MLWKYAYFISYVNHKGNWASGLFSDVYDWKSSNPVNDIDEVIAGLTRLEGAQGIIVKLERI